MILGACRGAQPATGSLRGQEVGNARTRLAPDGSYVHTVHSSAATLQPTARMLRDNAALVLPQIGAIRWSFTGDVERFEPDRNGTIAGTTSLGLHRLEPDDSTLVPFASSLQLSNDQFRLPDELSALLTGTRCLRGDFPGGWHGASACDAPPVSLDVGGGVSGGASALSPYVNALSGLIRSIGQVATNSLVQNVTLTQQGLGPDQLSFDLSWDDHSPADQPVLRLDTTFHVNIEPGRGGLTMFHDMRADVTYSHLITAAPCGPGSVSGEPCNDDGTTLFQGYRSILTTLGTDARAPGQSLNFDACTETSAVHAHVGVNIGCNAAMQRLVSVLPRFLRRFFGFLNFLGGSQPACHILAAITESGIEGGLCDQAVSLEQLMKLAVNPPTFRLSLRTAALTAAPDTDVHGEPCPDPIPFGTTCTTSGPTSYLTDPDGVLQDDELAVALGTFLPMEQVGPVLQVADHIHVAIEANANINADTSADPLPAETNVPITGADGSLTDAAVVAFARGGHIDVVGARADLREVRSMCSRGRGGLICLACALSPAPDYCTPGSDELPDFLDLSDVAGRVPGFDLRNTPYLAGLLSTAPLVAERLRALFAQPLPPGARYVSATSTDTTPGVAGGMEADFEYVLDRDKDGIPDESDNCPDTRNRDQVDTDGDSYGDACDLCPGLQNRPGNSEASEFGDLDGDGKPNGCDCDANANTCIDHLQEIDASGARVDCVVPDGAIMEGADVRYLGGSLEGNFDGDAFPDVCDADLDEDGVLNRDDNCPRGDGDALWELGVDDDPGQTDSGGSPLGDLCDPLCTHPSAGPLACGGAGGPGGGVPARPAASGIFWQGSPGANECVGHLCTIGSLGFCVGQAADACDNFAAIEIFTGIAQAEATLTPTFLGLDANFGTHVIQTGFDWDGDGQGELLVSSPLATAGGSPNGCPIGQDCVPLNLPEAGSVVVVASSDGHTLLRLDGVQAYAHFGQGLALADTTLAVGAPGVQLGQTPDGAVYVYDLIDGSSRLRTEVTGQADDRLGEDISIADATWPPLFLAGAPGADAGAGAILALDANQGERARFASSVPDAALSDGRMISRANGAWVVVGGAPSAYAGDGALLFFGGNGQDSVVRGQPSEQLGASLFDYADQLGNSRVLVGAPGYDGGAGAIHLYSASGDHLATRVYWGSRLGARLMSSGDLDGDGVTELWTSVTVNGEARAVALALPGAR